MTLSELLREDDWPLSESDPLSPGLSSLPLPGFEPDLTPPSSPPISSVSPPISITGLGAVNIAGTGEQADPEKWRGLPMSEVMAVSGAADV